MSPEKLRYHHLGIPSDKKRPGERYLADAKVYYTEPEADPFKIEWLRWMPDSPADEQLRTQPHIAFEVDDVEAELAKYDQSQIFAKPFVPFEGVKVAFIKHEDMLVEFFQKTR